MNELTLGWELEVESKTRTYEDAMDAAANHASVLGQALREVKEDGSLNEGGAEIVSEPRTLARWYALKPKVDTMISELVRDDFRSWNGNHCGMHVHVGRDELSAEALVRLFDLVFKNADYWRQLSGRTSTTWCPYDVHLPSIYADIPRAKSEGRDWYSRERTAIHLSSHNTVEFRLWRGSLKHERFWHNLETTHAMCAYAASDTGPASLEAYHEYVSAVAADHYPTLANRFATIGA